MQRKLILQGELAEKFGETLSVNAPRVMDAFKLLDINRPEFKHYIREATEKGLIYHCEVAGDLYDEKDMVLRTEPGDIILTPLPSGASSGGGKILAAVAIAAATFFTFGAAGPLAGATLFAPAGTAGAISIASIGYGIAVNLALAGIQQLLAPDPATDADAPESYLFNGSEQNIIEGDPVPILYGQLRVPGQPISIEVTNGEFNA